MRSAPLSFRHQKVQRLRRLLAKRSLRQEEGRVVVEGPTLLAEACRAGLEVESVFVVKGYSDEVVDRLSSEGTRVFELEGGVIERVADTLHPQEVLAIVAFRPVSLDELGESNLLVVGVDIRDPGNAGTLIRSAAAAGADGVILAGTSVDVLNPKTVRASAGTLFAFPVVAEPDTERALAHVAELGLKRFGAVVTGGRPYFEVDQTGPVALVIGNESQGLPEVVISVLDDLITIPMARETDSVNAGVAAAILCFEAARQRKAS